MPGLSLHILAIFLAIAIQLPLTQTNIIDAIRNNKTNRQNKTKHNTENNPIFGLLYTDV